MAPNSQAICRLITSALYYASLFVTSNQKCMACLIRSSLGDNMTIFAHIMWTPRDPSICRTQTLFLIFRGLFCSLLNPRNLDIKSIKTQDLKASCGYNWISNSLSSTIQDSIHPARLGFCFGSLKKSTNEIYWLIGLPFLPCEYCSKGMFAGGKVCIGSISQFELG